MSCVNTLTTLTAISLGGNLGLSENNGMISYVTDLKNMAIQVGMTTIWTSSHSHAVLWKWMSVLAILIQSFSLSLYLIFYIFLISSHFILHSNVVSMLWFWTPALTIEE